MPNLQNSDLPQDFLNSITAKCASGKTQAQCFSEKFVSEEYVPDNEWDVVTYRLSSNKSSNFLPFAYLKTLPFNMSDFGEIAFLLPDNSVFEYDDLSGPSCRKAEEGEKWFKLGKECLVIEDGQRKEIIQ